MGHDRVPEVLLGVVAGFLLCAVLLAATGVVAPPTQRISSPSHSMATATGCDQAPTEGGWVGSVPLTDHAVVAFNYTVVHDTAGLDVRADLDEPRPNAFVLAVTTERIEDGAKGSPPEGCQPSTTIDATVALPRGFESLAIVVDGRTVTTVESTGDRTPSFRPL